MFLTFPTIPALPTFPTFSSVSDISDVFDVSVCSDVSADVSDVFLYRRKHYFAQLTYFAQSSSIWGRRKIKSTGISIERGSKEEGRAIAAKYFTYFTYFMYYTYYTYFTYFTYYTYFTYLFDVFDVFYVVYTYFTYFTSKRLEEISDSILVLSFAKYGSNGRIVNCSSAFQSCALR